MKKKANQSLDDINPYKVDKLSKIPSWIIVVFLKFWAAAAAVFFIAIGGQDIGLDWSEDDSFDSDFRMIVAIALLMAIFLNYFIKQFVRMMHNRRNNTYRYNMINSRGFLAFILYIIYCFILSFILYFVTWFLGMKGWVLNPFQTVNYGIEPFTYGLSFIIIDTLFVLVKDLCVILYYRLAYKKQMSNNTPIIIDKKPIIE